MSDNLRRYHAIREALTQCYPGEPKGRIAHQLTILAAFINGIVDSKSSQLPSIATKIPNRAKPDSRVKRLSRWLSNKHFLEEVYCLPYADVLLHHLALETVVLVMNGSGVGWGCSALMIHVVDKTAHCHWPGECASAPRGIRDLLNYADDTVTSMHTYLASHTLLSDCQPRLLGFDYLALDRTTCYKSCQREESFFQNSEVVFGAPGFGN